MAHTGKSKDETRGETTGGRTWRDVRKGVMSEAKKSSRLQRGGGQRTDPLVVECYFKMCYIC